MKSMLSLALFAITLPALACEVQVKNAWARATVPGQMATGAYLDIRSEHVGQLLGISSPAAEMVELHDMKMDGGVMKMRAVEKLALPAKQTVSLKPGGLHVMLMQLKAPLAAGSTLPLLLEIERNGKIERVQVAAQVRANQSVNTSH